MMNGLEVRKKNDAYIKSRYNRFNRIYDADYILVCKRKEGQADTYRFRIHGSCLHT